MYTRALVKNLILPSISIGVVRAEGKDDDCDNTRKLVRPRDLPLYVDPPKCVTCSNTIESEDGFLLTTIRCARQELQTVLEQARIIQSEAMSAIDNIKRETSDAVSYLQQEENLLPRMGAIGIGAFAGYILAARKGILKKMLYSATGAGAIAAVAYPQEAREYSEEVLCELKKYAVITYHFVNGADVDWKKLDESTSCSGKIGNGSGKPLETKPRTPAGSGEANKDQPSDEIPRKAVPESKGVPEEGNPPMPCPQASPKECLPAVESCKTAKQSGMKSEPKDATEELHQQEQASPKEVLPAGESCKTPKQSDMKSEPKGAMEELLPQERPKNVQPMKRYRSYSEECQAKGSCIRRRPSDSSDSRDCKPKMKFDGQDGQRATRYPPCEKPERPPGPGPCLERELVPECPPGQSSSNPPPRLQSCPPPSEPPCLKVPSEFYSPPFTFPQRECDPPPCVRPPSKYCPPTPCPPSPSCSDSLPCLSRPFEFYPPFAAPPKCPDHLPPPISRPSQYCPPPPCPPPPRPSSPPPCLKQPCELAPEGSTSPPCPGRRENLEQSYRMKRQKSKYSCE